MKLEPKKYYWIKYHYQNDICCELVRIRRDQTCDGYYSFYGIGKEIPFHVEDYQLIDFKEVPNPFPDAFEII
jgi:hypothetical protein